MIEKTVLDMVTALAVIVNAEVGNLDKTAAYFYGASGKSAYTIYGRAEQRCANYGTCTGQGGEAAVNTAIGQALQVDDYGTVIKYIKVLYCQNVLWSANKIDQNMDDPIEIIGEGQAFWRILAPWMKEYDSSLVANTVFDRMFSTELNPQAANNYNYCIAKKYIDSFLASVMTTASDAATALGSLDEASGVSCASDITHGIVASIVTDAGTYTLKTTGSTNDIGGALQLPEAVKKVVDVLVAGTDTDIQVFASSSMYEYTSLRGIADGPGEDVWGDFETHHGDNWMSAIITDATSAVSSYSTAGAKNEAIEKTLQDSLAMQSIISDLEHAYHTEHSHTPAQKDAYWDSAAAKYFGTAAARSYTIYARANKRGDNYGQMSGSPAYSATNTAILTAFNAGPSETNAKTIIRNLKVIYTQAALRYAYLVDEDLAEGTDWNEHQAEGFAFYNNIAP